MTINVHFKQMDSSDSLRKQAEKKIQKLDCYFDSPAHAHWDFHFDRAERVAHCRVIGHINGRALDLSGGASGETFNKAIDLAMERLRKQIRRRKEIAKNHLHRLHLPSLSA